MSSSDSETEDFCSSDNAFVISGHQEDFGDRDKNYHRDAQNGGKYRELVRVNIHVHVIKFDSGYLVKTNIYKT